MGRQGLSGAYGMRGEEMAWEIYNIKGKAVLVEVRNGRAWRSEENV